MSLSSSDANLIVRLNNLSAQLTLYCGIFIIIFGVVGNITNTLVLSQKPFRSNACAWLLLVSSIAYFISILSGITSRVLSTWNADISSTDQVLCKTRIFIFFSSLTAAF
jgi:hypothetical protein